MTPKTQRLTVGWLCPALGQAQGAIAKDVPEVLFVCIQNSGRSQMAAGLMHQRAAGFLHVRSAGSDSAEVMNPNVVKAMAELGIDLSQEFPKPLTDEVVRAADAVIIDGLRGCLPDLSGEAVRRLERRRSCREDARGGARDPRRDR
jgi:arsenate reductase